MTSYSITCEDNVIKISGHIYVHEFHPLIMFFSQRGFEKFKYESPEYSFEIKAPKEEKKENDEPDFIDFDDFLQEYIQKLKEKKS